MGAVLVLLYRVSAKWWLVYYLLHWDKSLRAVGWHWWYSIFFLPWGSRAAKQSIAKMPTESHCSNLSTARQHKLLPTKFETHCRLSMISTLILFLGCPWSVHFRREKKGMVGLGVELDGGRCKGRDREKEIEVVSARRDYFHIHWIPLDSTKATRGQIWMEQYLI